MKILITGGSGLVGSSIVRGLKDLDAPYTILSPDRQELDLMNAESIKTYFNKYKPDYVIHSAAFVDMTLAEDQRGDKEGSVWKTNVVGSTVIAESCENIKARLIFISTNVVFSGRKENPGPYEEYDLPESNIDSLSWYGWTKREAEIRVSDISSDVSIIRICNVVSCYSHPKLDYLRKIVKLYDDGKLYSMFGDQFVTLTYTPPLVETIVCLIEGQLSGIYHVSSSNISTPFIIANTLLDKARNVKGFIQESSLSILSKEILVRYPQFCTLDCKKTQSDLHLRFPTWQEIVDGASHQIKQS